MLNVMLVDDEPLALEGLKLLVDWAAEGFSICAECPDAAEALRLLVPTHPDLIVTDLRMPGMDGLELMLAVKALGFDGQFVVVSGYGDFEYAQRALNIGVAGYLLKPIEPIEASAVLAHVRSKLIRRETAGMRSNTAYSMALLALLSGAVFPTDVSLPPEAVGSIWRLATWGAPLCYGEVEEILGTFPEGSATTHIVEDKEYLTLRWKAGGAEPDWSAVEALLRHFHRRLVQSETTEDPNRLNALRLRLSAQLNAASGALRERMEVLARTVALRQADECRSRCAELETFCNACGADVKKAAWQQLVSECSRQLADRPEPMREFLQAQTGNFVDLCLLAIRLLAPAQERISDRVAAYVTAHAGEHITVDSVATAMGYNATYLGRVFRDERGVGLREWLSALRVEHAAGLLCHTDACVCEIAEQVGYRQYKRFLRHFKQRYGVTPEQYRKRSAAGKPVSPPV